MELNKNDIFELVINFLDDIFSEQDSFDIYYGYGHWNQKVSSYGFTERADGLNITVITDDSKVRCYIPKTIGKHNSDFLYEWFEQFRFYHKSNDMKVENTYYSEKYKNKLRDLLNE